MIGPSQNDLVSRVFLTKPHVGLAIYEKDKNLLEIDGWMTLKRLSDRSEFTERLVKQAKLHLLNYSTMYKFDMKFERITMMPNDSKRRMATQTGWIQTN